MPLAEMPKLAAAPKHVAVIHVHQHADDHCSYTWEGHASWPVLVTYEFEERAVVGWQDDLPWQLEKTATVPARQVSLYRRVEAIDGLA